MINVGSMKYLLDTCTVSDFVRGYVDVVERMKATAPELIYVSTVTRMEIDYGLALQPQRAVKIGSLIESFLSAITIVPFDTQAARATALVRASLRKMGQPVGAYDALIAGTAIAHGMIVVTSNFQEFQRIDGLVVDNWRQ